MLDDSFQGVRRLLFILVFNGTTVNVNNPINNTTNRVERDSHRIHFIPRVNITNYTDGRNFMINLLKIKSKNMKKSERLQQDKDMIT